MALLTQPITILDGGMGQELLARSKREITTMWSADIMLHEPELVKDLHYDFIQAGATVITLNTYTATPQRLQLNNALPQLSQLHASAIRAAQDAITLSGKTNINIAGCLPPLVASYHPDESPNFALSLDAYRQIVSLQQAAVDLFICETMSSINEAKAACTAAKESGKPVWVAFSLSDENPDILRGGERLEDALKALVPSYTDVILLNCSRPETIEHALPLLTQSVANSGVYANGFTAVDSLYPGTTVASLSARQDLDPVQYAQHALLWANMGVTFIGGCCEIRPNHIEQLCSILEHAGYSLKQ